MAEFILENQPELQHRIAQGISSSGTNLEEPYVFVFWDDPSTEPSVVHACRAALRANIGSNYKLIELNSKTLPQWIDIPAEYARLTKDFPAQFSDIARMRLLAKHGGLWIDSTCLITEHFSSAMRDIYDLPFFLFRYAGSRTGNWFMWSKPNAYLLHAIKAVLELWWEKEARLTNYFMWHDIAEMLYWTDPQSKAEWDAMPARHPRNALKLLNSLSKPFDSNEWETTLAGSFVHKLTHKYPQRLLDADTMIRHVMELYQFE